MARIDELNPTLNAFITVTHESALAEARAAEAEIHKGDWRGPLHGIPLGLKDLIDTAGIKTTCGSALFADRIPTEDADVVERLKQAGAVLIGKQNMNGVGALPLTRNDWDVLFGNSPSFDTFAVTMVTDDRSRIKDLGALNWTDAFQVPALPAYPVPTRDPDVAAIVGHIYVVHTKDTETDLYALFRVEALEPLKSVTISWKSVQRPLGD